MGYKKTPFDHITYKIIGCCHNIHSELGPGLLESVYEVCLESELTGLGFEVERQVPIPVVYGRIKLQAGFRADLLVERRVIVEVKSVDAIARVHQAQILTYMRLSNRSVGLLINFNVANIRDGIKRFLL